MNTRDVFLTKVATAAFIDEIEKQGGIFSVVKGLAAATKGIPKAVKALRGGYGLTRGGMLGGGKALSMIDRMKRLWATPGVKGHLKTIGKGAILPAAGAAGLYAAGKGIGAARRRRRERDGYYA
jgi:hypothetical protein